MTSAREPPASQRVRRAGFWVYTATLLTATLWPNLTITPILVERPDLLIHAGTFGLWTALLLASGYLGPALRLGTVLKAAVIAIAFAGADESAQAIPIVQRHAAWDDFGANVLGIGIVAVIVAAAAAVRPRSAPPGPPGGTRSAG